MSNITPTRMEIVTLGSQTAWIDPRGAVWFPAIRLLCVRVPDIRASLFPDEDEARVAALAAPHDPEVIVLLCTGEAPAVTTAARVVQVGPLGVYHWSTTDLHFSMEMIEARPLVVGTHEGPITAENELISLPEIVIFPPFPNLPED